MGNIQYELDKSIEQEENLSKTSIERSEVLDISDALKCHRMRYLKYYGHPGKSVDARGLRSFLMGRVIEKVIVAYLRYRNVIVNKGQYLKHYLDPRIKGKTDFTINRNGQLFVSELKSYDGFGFWRRKKDQPNISKLHEAQALNYVDILQHQGENIESQALIVETGRDNLNIMETLTKSIDQIRDELHNDWETLIKAIDNKKIPAVLPDFPKDKQCTWCTRKEVCKNLYEEEKTKK